MPAMAGKRYGGISEAKSKAVSFRRDPGLQGGNPARYDCNPILASGDDAVTRSHESLDQPNCRSCPEAPVQCGGAGVAPLPGPKTEGDHGHERSAAPIHTKGFYWDVFGSIGKYLPFS